MRCRLPIFLLFNTARKSLLLAKPIHCTMASTNPENYKDAKSIYEFKAKTIQGEEISLDKYQGHVAIIVNVASQCGFAQTHYQELNELYDQYADEKGLRILAFPCNQFASQEPGGAEEICTFVSKKNVKFDMFDKVDVNGSHTHPLYKFLKHKQGGTLGDFIKWNFTKFVIDKEGKPVGRFGPNTTPKGMLSTLEKYW